jgi:hypothetical protein
MLFWSKSIIRGERWEYPCETDFSWSKGFILGKISNPKQKAENLYIKIMCHKIKALEVPVGMGVSERD